MTDIQPAPDSSQLQFGINNDKLVESPVIYRKCPSCTYTDEQFRHLACVEIWWEDEDDDMVNREARGQCFVCDCEVC